MDPLTQDSLRQTQHGEAREPLSRISAFEGKSGARILTVDDEESILRLMARTLGGVGYSVEAAGSGQQALNLMKTHHFDIVITDIAMPGMSGIDLAKEVIRTYATDIVFMTGVIDRYTYARMIPIGARDFIQKPFSPDEVVLRVNRILREQHMREELDRLQQEYTHAQKLESIGQLSAGIAHEINTPIQYIGDNASFLKDGYQDLNRLIDQFFKLLDAAKQRGLDRALVRETEAVIDDVDVDFIRQEFPAAIDQTLDGVKKIRDIVKAMKFFSHPGDQTHQTVTLNRNIETAVLISKNEWKYTADVILDLDPDLPEIACNPSEINQVLLNLIINASHAVAEMAKKEKKGRIRVTSRGLDDRIEITIQDNGHGIPGDIRDKIFDPFFTTKPAGQGTGQGLSIARTIIESRHGGTLGFTSNAGNGTTFVLGFPRK